MKCAWRQNKKIYILFGAYIVYTIILTLSPFEFSVYWLKLFLERGLHGLIKFQLFIKIEDIVGNVLLFIPFGYLLSEMFLHNGYNQQGRKYWGPILAGGLLSGSIELAQLFLPRSPTLIDLVCNVGGTIIGYHTGYRWIITISNVLERRRIGLSISVVMVLLSTAAFALMVFMPPRLNKINNWDEIYPLVIGNERTMDRPWEGEVFLVAVYNQALRKREVRWLFRSGWNNPDIEVRRKMGGVAIYTFNEGMGQVIYDRSQFGEPLHLEGSHIDWVKGSNGISIQNDTNAVTSKSGKKIVRAISETSQLTVEVWIRTKNVHQQGPARIVSLSYSPELRNFTLGQWGRDIHLRIRTDLAGANGSRIQMKVRNVLREQTLQHIVATFHRGTERLFVDGDPSRGGIQADIDYIPIFLDLGDNDAVRLGWCFLIFNLWSFILYFVFRKYRFLFSVLIVGSVVTCQQMMFYFLYGQPFGWFFTSTALTFGCLGGYLASLLHLEFKRN